MVRGFEKPAARWAAGHRGVDLALEAGGHVLAPYEGKVVFAGTVVDRQVLTLEHPDGRRSSFEPVMNPLPVGSRVQAGDAIAQLDSEVQHCAPSFCLHWGVREPAPGSETARRGLDYTNPLLLLGLEDPSVLLPIGDDFAA
ncbi:M23 family metallopeptidase [Rothia nasimurium]|uniref:M23 family metallopeptidase n=1 Tax=Rothia nasimurium TaxID=85336 RepID=UPI001F440892|nr:M23 family metallopeptidase [Rothia nasimurium]